MTTDFLIEIAEYVGANVPFDYEKYSGEITPFLKDYSGTLRVWSGSINGMEEIQEILKDKDYISVTRSYKGVKNLLEDRDEDISEVILTTQSGKGFDPYEIIKAGIREYPDHKEVNFFKEVLRYNIQQEEILLVEIFEIKIV